MSDGRRLSVCGICRDWQIDAPAEWPLGEQEEIILQHMWNCLKNT